MERKIVVIDKTTGKNFVAHSGMHFKDPTTGRVYVSVNVKNEYFLINIETGTYYNDTCLSHFNGKVLSEVTHLKLIYPKVFTLE